VICTKIAQKNHKNSQIMKTFVNWTFEVVGFEKPKT